MSHVEWVSIWEKLTGLWPRWDVNAHIARSWKDRFASVPVAAMEAAVESHYAEHSGKFQPDLEALRRLCWQFRSTGEPRDDDRAAREEMFFASSRLDQFRMMRDSYRQDLAKMRVDTDEYNQTKAFIVTAEKAIARLYEKFGTHQADSFRTAPDDGEPLPCPSPSRDKPRKGEPELVGTIQNRRPV